MFWLYQDSILQYFYEGFVYCDISHSGSSLFWLYQDSILQLTWTQCRLPSHARIVVGMLSTTVYSSLVYSISYTMVYHVLLYIATSAPMGCQLEKSSQSSCPTVTTMFISRHSLERVDLFHKWCDVFKQFSFINFPQSLLLHWSVCWYSWIPTCAGYDNVHTEHYIKHRKNCECCPVSQLIVR